MSSVRVLLVCFVIIGLTIGEPLPPFNLQCDNNLVGLTQTQLKSLHDRHHFATDSRFPLFSWSLNHTDKGATCTAFQLVLSTEVTFSNIVWNSGLIKENKQELRYDGPALQGGQVYLWKVTWWDEKGIAVSSSEIGHFLAVNLTPSDWAPVKWISPPNGMNTAPTFTKDVTLSSSSVGTATLYVSGLGFFRAWINGVDILSKADPPISLTPGWTNYEIRVPYMTFDVSSLITTNQLSIKISLGEGWRNTTQFPPHDKPFPSTDSSPYVLRVMLNIIFNDTSSTKLSILSDKTWSVQSSHIQANSIYNGEVYDATITPKVIGNAIETTGPSGTMYLPMMSYIAETGIIDHAQEITVDPSSTDDHYKQVVDFGANTAGFVRIKVDEIKSGQVLQLTHAEILTHPPYGKKDGSLYYDNLRSARQLDYYTSDGTETYYQPTFTYHGFRYALVINYPRKLTSDDLYKIRINSNLKSNSKFNVSTELLNEIQANVVRGHLSNLMSVPTDCDQRDERLGWMGDAGLSADAMALNFHMESFLPHRTMLMKDEQINGNVPDVVPFYHGGGRPSDPSWGAAYPQTVWVLWKYYGDTNTAKMYYDSLLEYIDFLEVQIPKEGIGKLNGRYGDWVPPPPNKKIDNSYPSAFSFMQNIQQMAEIAHALGDTANATRLNDMFTKHAAEFNEAFYTSSNNQYFDDMQISYTLPLALGIVPPSDKDKVVTNFIHRITGPDKSHVTAGIVGVKPLLPVLTDLKQHDLAMTIVTQVDYPSWGYMIHNTDEPATAIWELWNANTAGPGMNSRNHHMFSSVSSWLQTDMIGLKQIPYTYGYKYLDLYPAQSLDLSSASLILEHPKLIKYSWQRQGGIQCGKGVESSKGLSISCGEDGFIEKVLFASYGNPVGSCGYHRHGNCHSIDSISHVERHCVNKSHCTIPTHNDYWNHDCGLNIIKWLSVAVQCTNKLPSLKMSISVPIGSRAKLHLPSYGMSHMTIWDNGDLFYSTNPQLSHTTTINSAAGLDTVQWSKEDSTLDLDIISGHYEFTVKGEQAEEIHEYIITTDNCTLSCSNGERIITSIDWVSYGNALQVGAIGSCHSGASRYIVENTCLGKTKCSLALSESFSGVPCTANEWKLAVKYSCNKRML